eukprot:SAG31_NODE_363_length_16899_cov_9.812976_13_plen_264_part_00
MDDSGQPSPRVGLLRTESSKEQARCLDAEEVERAETARMERDAAELVAVRHELEVQTALAEVRAGGIPNDELSLLLSTVCGVMKRAAGGPDDTLATLERYHRIPVANRMLHNRVGRHRGGLGVLCVAGFVDCGDGFYRYRPTGGPAAAAAILAALHAALSQIQDGSEPAVVVASPVAEPRPSSIPHVDIDDGRRLLILDLDGTLLHAAAPFCPPHRKGKAKNMHPDSDYDFTIFEGVKNESGVSREKEVVLRPGLEGFLRSVQ